MWKEMVSQIAASCKRNPAVLKRAQELDEVMKSGGMTHRRAGKELIKVFVKDEVENMKN